MECVSERLKGKLVDALVQPVVYKLETYINNIEASKRRILELRDAAHIAQQADMKFTLENTSAGASSPDPTQHLPSNSKNRHCDF